MVIYVKLVNFKSCNLALSFHRQKFFLHTFSSNKFILMIKIRTKSEVFFMIFTNVNTIFLCNFLILIYFIKLFIIKKLGSKQKEISLLTTVKLGGHLSISSIIFIAVIGLSSGSTADNC